jgi:hypothetical protein
MQASQHQQKQGQSQQVFNIEQPSNSQQGQAPMQAGTQNTT